MIGGASSCFMRSVCRQERTAGYVPALQSNPVTSIPDSRACSTVSSHAGSLNRYKAIIASHSPPHHTVRNYHATHSATGLPSNRHPSHTLPGLPRWAARGGSPSSRGSDQYSGGRSWAGSAWYCWCAPPALWLLSGVDADVVRLMLAWILSQAAWHQPGSTSHSASSAAHASPAASKHLGALERRLHCVCMPCSVTKALWQGTQNRPPQHVTCQEANCHVAERRAGGGRDEHQAGRALVPHPRAAGRELHPCTRPAQPGHFHAWLHALQPNVWPCGIGKDWWGYVPNLLGCPEGCSLLLASIFSGPDGLSSGCYLEALCFLSDKRQAGRRGHVSHPRRSAGCPAAGAGRPAAAGTGSCRRAGPAPPSLPPGRSAPYRRTPQSAPAPREGAVKGYSRSSHRHDPGHTSVHSYAGLEYPSSAVHASSQEQACGLDQRGLCAVVCFARRGGLSGCAASSGGTQGSWRGAADLRGEAAGAVAAGHGAEPGAGQVHEPHGGGHQHRRGRPGREEVRRQLAHRHDRVQRGHRQLRQPRPDDACVRGARGGVARFSGSGASATPAWFCRAPSGTCGRLPRGHRPERAVRVPPPLHAAPSRTRLPLGPGGQHDARRAGAEAQRAQHLLRVREDGHQDARDDHQQGHRHPPRDPLPCRQRPAA